MKQRLTPRDRNRRRPALIDRPETFLGRELRLKHMRGILNLPATSTGQIAAEQRLQHQHERILFASLNLLLEDVTRHRPHLRNWHRHQSSLQSRFKKNLSSRAKRAICSFRRPPLHYPIRRTPVPCSALTIAFA